MSKKTTRRQCGYEVEETLSQGWMGPGKGFPEFSFDSRRVLVCTLTHVTGGETLIVFAKDTNEAKLVIFDDFGNRSNVVTPSKNNLFKAPTSWQVDLIKEDPSVLVSWAGGTQMHPPIYSLQDFAKRVHEKDLLADGCEKCEYVFPERHSRVPLKWTDSAIGDTFSWKCPKCGHVNMLSSCNF